MVFQIGIVYNLMNESRRVFNSCRIGCGIRAVERQMEREVGELFFQIQEIL